MTQLPETVYMYLAILRLEQVIQHNLNMLHPSLLYRFKSHKTNVS